MTENFPGTTTTKVLLLSRMDKKFHPQKNCKIQKKKKIKDA